MSTGHQSNPSDSTTTCSVSLSPDSLAWREYLARNDAATVFHDPRWGEVMRAAYGNQPYYLTAERAGATVGVLLLVLQKSLLFGSHLCSLPYLDAAGIVADDDAARDALLAGACRLMEESGAAWVELRQPAALPESIPARTDKVTLRLALPADPEVLWKAVGPKVRNQVRKAQRAGLTVESGGGECLDAFHVVYVRTMRDLGSPPHSRRFFDLTVQQLGQAVRFFVIRSGQQPVAASLTLTDRHAVHVPWAGSDWRVRAACANMLLYSAMLDDACRRGIACFDFGRSTRDSGTYRFKTQWGAHEVALYWHFLLPAGGSVPTLRPDSPKYRLMVAIWKRLPVAVARMLGPPIIAKLS